MAKVAPEINVTGRKRMPVSSERAGAAAAAAAPIHPTQLKGDVVERG